MKARMIFRLFSIFLTVSLLAGAGMVLPAARSSAMQAATQAPAPTATPDLGGITLQQVSYTATVLKPELVATMIPLNAKTGELSAAVLSQNGGAIEFMGRTADKLPLARGTIFVTGISPNTPFGLLRKVTEIRETSTGVTVQTTQATLEEAIENVDVSKDVSRLVASMQPANDHPGGGVLMMVDPSAAAGDVRILLKDQKLSDKVTANGEILIRPAFSLHMKIESHILKQFTFTDKTSIKANVKLNAGSSGKLGLSKSIKTVTYPTMTIWVGSFPIVITPVLEVFIGMDGQVFAGLTMEGSYSNSPVITAEWNNNTLSYTRDLYDRFDYKPPAAMAKASARIFVRPCLSLKLYGLTGPYIQVEGYLRLELSPLKDPTWIVYNGIKGEVGIRLECFNIIKSISYTPKLFFKENIFTPTATRTSVPTSTHIADSLSTSTSPPGAGGRGSTPIPPSASTGGNVLILYDPTKVVLINTSPGSISLQGLTFRRVDSSGRETAGFTSDIWANYVPADKFKAFPSQDCVAVRTDSKKEQLPCTTVWRFITSQAKYYFWMAAQGSSQFQVWKDDTLLQTCDISAGSCSFSLPSS